MFDFGWQEFLVIAFVLVLVVGPKDLPKLFSKAGKILGKIKQISREFYDQINEAAEMEEINNLKNDLSEHTSLDSYKKEPQSRVEKRNNGKFNKKK